MFYLASYRNRISVLAQTYADTTKSKWLLFVIAFSESSFFLIPPDVVLLAILIVAPQKYIYYSSLTTIASVLGGILGYVIGFFFFQTLGQWIIGNYGLVDELGVVGNLFADNAFWSIFISAFTPIPYKVFTLSAGFFKINFFTFLISSIIGRGLRFFTLGILMNRFGPVIGRTIYRYFNIFLLVICIFIILIVLYFYLY